MKILCLCKRHPQGKDLLTRPYGRFSYLPHLLAQKGHSVTILLCNYKRGRQCNQNNFPGMDDIHWTSISFPRQGPLAYPNEAKRIIHATEPDWIIGFSDTYYGILAQHLAQRFGCKSLIDAYDNYESYMPWCQPLHYFWRRALRKADLVTAAGSHLADLMSEKRLNKPAIVVPMAADPIGLKPLNQAACRQKLGLPPDKILIGYCGALYANRGINVLFDAYKILLQEHKNIELLVSGRKESGVTIPDGARWLGYVPDENMPDLLNSMDVLTVINKSSLFGNYSYPIKLYEAMCCQVPVVASKTLSTQWILDGFPDLLAVPNDSIDLSQKITAALQYKRIDYGHQQGWEESADVLEKALEENLHSSIPS